MYPIENGLSRVGNSSWNKILLVSVYSITLLAVSILFSSFWLFAGGVAFLALILAKNSNDNIARAGRPILIVPERVDPYVRPRRRSFGNLMFPALEELIRPISRFVCSPIADETLQHRRRNFEHSFRPMSSVSGYGERDSVRGHDQIEDPTLPEPRRRTESSSASGVGQRDRVDRRNRR